MTTAPVMAEWYVLRDLSRPNTLTPGYKKLQNLGFEVFTPMHNIVTEHLGQKKRRKVPVIHDLLFVKSERDNLDPVIRSIDTLQYRFVKGKPAGTAMTVCAKDMERFINAVTSRQTVRYYHPGEVTSDMIGAEVRLHCEGALNGTTGHLLRMRGSRKKRLIVQIGTLLSATVELPPETLIEPLQP